jgi:hypothetical protein
MCCLRIPSVTSSPSDFDMQASLRPLDIIGAPPGHEGNAGIA